MTEEKKRSFILYADLDTTIDKLTDEEAGLLFKTILRHVNDREPATDNRIVLLTFESIKQSLKRDHAKYSKKVERLKANSLLGVQAKAAKAAETQAPVPNGNQMVNGDNHLVKKRTKRKPVGKKINQIEGVSDTVSVSVSDSVSDIYINGKYKEEELAGFANLQTWINLYAANVGKMKEPLLIDEYLNIRKVYSMDQIKELLTSMHNHKPLLIKNVSASLTFMNWARNRDWLTTSKHHQENDINERLKRSVPAS